MKRLLSLLAALCGVAAIPWAAAAGVWFGDEHSVGFMESASGRIAAWGPAAGVRSIVPLSGGGAWLVTARELVRVSRDGITLASVPLPAEPSGVLAASDDTDDGIWVASNGIVRRYDGSGNLARAFEHAASMTAIAVAGPEAVFVASATGIVRFRHDGSVAAGVLTRDLGLAADVTHLLLDRSGGYVWAIAGDEAIRLDALGGLRHDIRLRLDPSAGSFDVDPASGTLWALGSRLQAFDREGNRLLDVASPVRPNAEPARIASDPPASLLWIGDRTGLGALDPRTLQWLGHAAVMPVTLLARPGLSLRPAVEFASLAGHARTIRLKLGAACGNALCEVGERYLRSLELVVDASGPIDRPAHVLERGSGVVTLETGDIPPGATLEVSADDAYGVRSEALRIDSETFAAQRLRAQQKANAPPSVSMTAPTANAVFVAPASIGLSASASDSDGTLAKVEFFQGATRLGTDTVAPYTWSWTNVPVGTYTLTARAYDNLGAATTSAARTVQVKANAAPTVTLSAPLNNSTYTAPATIGLAATAGDSDGTVAKVEFFQGATRINTDTTAPYAYTWANVAGGSYALTARATDDKGAVTTSAVVTVKVNKPPAVSITAPVNNASLVGPLSVTINAAASDADGSVAKVQFYRDGVLLGQDTVAPYSLVWPNATVGTHVLTAKATDNLGAISVSAAVTVTVRSNVVPTVSLTAPYGGSAFVAGQQVALAATAADPDGAITKVEFFAATGSGNTLLGSDSTSPYAIAVPLSAGTTALTAVATDNHGAKATSAPVSVTVTQNQPPAITLVEPVNGKAYAASVPPDITLIAAVSDPEGRVASVRFYAQSWNYDGSASDPVLVGTVASPPYQAVWSAVPITGWFDASGQFVPPGAPTEHTVWADATDDAGATAASEIVSFYVNDRSPYRLRLTSPSTADPFLDPLVFATPATIVLVSDPAASFVPGPLIARVEFLDHGSVVGSLSAPTGIAGEYAYVWRQVPAGTHAVSVRLTDHDGRTSTSVPVEIRVAPPDQPTRLAVIAPADGQVYHNVVSSLTNLPVGLTVNDPDSGLRRVQVRADGSDFAYLYGPPWSATIPSLARGTHAISARAVDEANRAIDSRPVFIDVGSFPRYPTVVLVNPAAGGTFSSGSPVTLTADVVGVDGVVSKVEFHDTQSGLLGTATTAPYSIARNLPPGLRTLKAVAYSGAAQSSESRAVTVTVTSTNPPPSVTLTSPANGQAFVAGSAIALSATATDNGVVSKVEFFSGTTLLGADTLAPYGLNWTAAATGTYTLTARATDTLGASATSAPVTIDVVPAVAAINLTAPVAGARVVANQPFALTARAAIPGRSINRIEFFAGTSLLGSVPAPGGLNAFTATLSAYGVPPGNHTLTARVVATDGYALTSPGVAVTAVDFGVGLGHPYDGQVFLAPASIRIAASPSIPGGTLASVDFHGDGVLLGSRSAPPYTHTWTNVPAGAHTITVKARDATGLVASASVGVTVTGYPSISLDPGIAGSTVNDSVVNLSGIVRAPTNSAVIVNGRLAALDRQGRFYVNALRLVPGTNSINVTLNTQDGDPIVQTYSLTSAGTAPFSLEVTPQEGLAPLSGTLTLTNRGNVPFARAEFDWNDDGIAETTLASLPGGQAVFDLSFLNPGLHTLRVTVYDASNRVVYLARRWVMAYGAHEIGSRMLEVYNNLLLRLGTGNIEGALECLVGEARERYRRVFTALGANLPGIAAQLGTFVGGSLSADFGEIIVSRPTAGGNQAFMIYLVRGRDGLWRIESM